MMVMPKVWQAERLDSDAVLIGPERRDAGIRLTLGHCDDRIAAHSGALLSRVRPMLDPDVLPAGEWVRPFSDVAGRQQVGIALDGQRRVAANAVLNLETTVG